MANILDNIMHNGTEYNFPGDVQGPASSTDGHLAVFDGASGKVIKDGGTVPTVPTNVSSFNNDSGYLTSSTGVTSVNGNTGAVTVNDTKVDSSAPSSPTEGTLWYDSANDKLKAYNGSSWDEIGGGIMKVFTLSGTTGATALAEAQAAYDWWVNGGVPIIKYGSVYYNLSYAEASGISFTYNVTNQSDSGTTTTFNGLNRLYFTVSSNVVTAITLFQGTINLRTTAPTSGDNRTITIVI